MRTPFGKWSSHLYLCVWNSRDKEYGTLFTFRLTDLEIQHLLEFFLCWVIHEILLSIFQFVKSGQFSKLQAKAIDLICCRLRVEKRRKRKYAFIWIKYITEILRWDIQLCRVNRQIKSNIRVKPRFTTKKVLSYTSGTWLKHFSGEIGDLNILRNISK